MTVANTIGSNPINPVADSLNAANRRTLTSVLGAIRAARADIKSSGSRGSKQAYQRLIKLLAYVTGFLDGMGINDGGPANSGFGSIFEVRPTVTSIDAQLDKVEEEIQRLLGPETRGLTLGGALIAIGIAFKVLAEKIRGE